MSGLQFAIGLLGVRILLVVLILSSAVRAQPSPPFNLQELQERQLKRAQVAENERREFDARLTQYLACWQGWLRSNASLDAEQQAALAELLQKQTPETSEGHWKLSNTAARSPLVNHFPALFVEGTTPLSQLTQPATVRPLLRENQIAILQQAVAEREEFRYAAYRDYALAILDSELFLSAQQREALAGERDHLMKVLDEPWFFINPSSTGYLPWRPVVLVVSPGVRAQLSEHQRQRVAQLESFDSRPGSSMMFRTDESWEVWDERLNARIQVCQEEIALNLILRVDELEREGLIPGDAASKLRTVAKGVSVNLCDELQEKAKSSLAAFAARTRIGQQAAVSTTGISTANLAFLTPQDQDLWTTACGPVVLKELQKLDIARTQQRRLARDRAVLAMLDRELWLSPEQRGKLLPVLSAALPPLDRVLPNREALRDVTWLIHAFCLSDAVKIRELLQPAQWEAWQRMQACVPVSQERFELTAVLLMRGNRQLPMSLFTFDGADWDVDRHGRAPGSPPEIPDVQRRGNR